MIKWFQLALVTFLDNGYFEGVLHLTVKEDVWIHNITVPTFFTVETTIAKALLVCITFFICILFTQFREGGLLQHSCDGWLCSYSCILSSSTIIIVCTCEERESKEIIIIHHITLFLLWSSDQSLWHDMITSIGQCLLSYGQWLEGEVDNTDSVYMFLSVVLLLQILLSFVRWVSKVTTIKIPKGYCLVLWMSNAWLKTFFKDFKLRV